MKYDVELSARARADLQRLRQGLVDHSEDVAERWYDSFREGVQRLRNHPLTCGLAYESAHADREIRHLLFGLSRKRKYRALFWIRGDIVYIVTVRAPGERPLASGEIESAI